MSPSGLSFAYLPPFSIVARFFITASIFGLLGSLLGLFMALKGSLSLQALVHTFTLGFMAMTMLGALFQMLPVVAGAVIEKPLRKATYTHIGMITGTFLLLLSFLTGDRVSATAGAITLLLTVVSISSLMLYKLIRLKTYTPTSNGMRYAIAFFIVGTLLGVSLVLGLGGGYAQGLYVHVNLMLLGWVGVLIASVAFQVIEMFFVTPSYPRWFAWYFPPAMLLCIVLSSASYDSLLLKIPASLVFSAFSLLTFNLLLQRRRKVPDPLVRLWLLGMVLLLLSMLTYPFIGVSFKAFLLFLFLFGSFAHTVILAMMYRIIPFLVWMHLSTKGVPNAPTMHEVISPKRVWKHFYLHILSVVVLLLGFLYTNQVLLSLTSVLYTASFSFLLWNISYGSMLYLKRASGSGDAPQQI